MSKASIDHVRLQVLAPRPDSFVLGRSRLGEGVLPGATYNDRWQDVTSRLNSLNVSRGGSVDGASTSIDTGRLTARFVDPDDVASNPIFSPNRLVRAVKAGPTPEVLNFPVGQTEAELAHITIPFTHKAGNRLFLRLDSFGYYAMFSKVEIYRVSTGAKVGGWRYGQFSSPSAWTSSAEGARWSRTGGSSGNPAKPFTEGWGDPDSKFWIRCEGASEPARPYVAVRTLTDLTAGVDYELRVSGLTWTSARLENFIPVTIGTADATGNILFTGRIEDVFTEYSKDGRHSWATLTATDAIRDLSQTPRYGAVAAANLRVSTWGSRVVDVGRSAQVRVNAVADKADYEPLKSITTSPSAWSRYGSMAASTVQNSKVSPQAITSEGIFNSLTFKDAEIPAGDTVQYTSGERGIRTTLTGLTPGAYYGVFMSAYIPVTSGVADPSEESRRYRLSVGDSEGETVALGNKFVISGTPDAAVMWVAFRATATTAVLSLSRAFDGTLSSSTAWRPEYVQVSFAYQHKILDANDVSLPPLRDVVYESTCFNHIAMACDSVGVDWYINRQNVLDFRLPNTARPVKVALSDAARPSYTEASISFDTRNVVNSLSIDNHGRQPDPSTPGNHVAQDSSSTFISDEGVRAFSPRGGSLDMCVSPVFVEERAAKILDAIDRPELKASSIRIDAQDVPQAAGLELFDRIRVTHRGRTLDYAVVGITHEVSPTKWLTTLELRKDS